MREDEPVSRAKTSFLDYVFEPPADETDERCESLHTVGGVSWRCVCPAGEDLVPWPVPLSGRMEQVNGALVAPSGIYKVAGGVEWTEGSLNQGQADQNPPQMLLSALAARTPTPTSASLFKVQNMHQGPSHLAPPFTLEGSEIRRTAATFEVAAHVGFSYL